jgi:HD-GYP domain-containing protein (c-di-GMP phosphodiesterase class II)
LFCSTAQLSHTPRMRRLTAKELAIVREHPQTGYEMLLRQGLSREVLGATHGQHEYLDGSGYPRD